MESHEVAEFVEKVRLELSAIDDLPIVEHAQKLENIHRSLGEALSTIDGL